MELVEVIKKRRSMRRYKPDKIPKEDFMILDVAFYSYKQ
jgi:nitroreductase